MQTSCYDVVARQSCGRRGRRVFAVKGIESFYTAVRRSGGEGTGFYRKYFENLGIGMQGNYDADGDGVADGDSEGPVGIDCEFLEAALMFVSVPDAFFGLEPNYDGTGSPYSAHARLARLLENGKPLVRRRFLRSVHRKIFRCSCLTYRRRLRSLWKCGSPNLQFKFKVFYNGAQAQYKEENRAVSLVKVPFENGKVEIKGV